MSFRVSLALATALLMASASGACSAAGLRVVARGPALQPFGDRLEVRSQALGRDMIVTVTPPLTGLPKHRKVAAIYALDGGYGEAGPIGSAMSGGEAIAPVLVVAVEWPPGQWKYRDEDLFFGSGTIDGQRLRGRGAAYETFLLKELKPYIEAHYPADPAQAILFGHSAAGTFAAGILVRDPDAFAGWIIGSPALEYDPRVLARAATVSRTVVGKRVFVAAGAAENPTMVADTHSLAEALSGPGSRLAVRSKLYPGARHGGYFTPLFAESFAWMLPPPQTYAASAADLASLAGDYRTPDGQVLRIIARDDQLFLRREGRRDRELKPRREGVFEIPELREQVTFSPQGLVASIAGARTPAVRVR